ncbi:ABC transporter substrate-binding protein [Allocoleopsis franciscana]|nr:ABC transporter substrate-binding protein [Allocoleopsis franciscana]
MRVFAPIPAPWRHWLAVMLVMFSAIAFSSCRLADYKTQAAQIPRLVVSTLSDPKTFNYALSSESPNVFSYIYEGLITENGLTGAIEPALAERWQISEDKQRIVFTLRQGLKWSDGEPLTVDDVVFTYNEIYFNELIPTPVRDVLKIGESEALPTVRKLSDRQVEFTVPEPFAPFLRITSLPILPAHSLQESITTKDAQGKPKFLTMLGTSTDPSTIIVNGPYQLASYVPNERVIFQKNPYYWRQPQPYIEQFIWQIVESTDTSLIQFRSGGLDVLSISPDYFSLLKREEKRSNFSIHEDGPAPGTSFIAFNLNKGRRNGKSLIDPIKSRWFNTVAFRQAVAHAINREQMNNNIFRGLGELQNSPISVQSPYYLSSQEGLKIYDYNPARAKELLLGAGFKYNKQGQLFDADGNRVHFTLITNAGNKIREAMAAQIQADLSQIGMQVDLFPLAFNTLLDKLNNTINWECYLLGFTGGIEPNDGANVWSVNGGSHRFNQPAKPGQPPIEGREISDWEREIGRLYILGAKELDEAKRKAIYAETQRITQDYLPFIYLVSPLSMSAVRNRVQGIQFSALGGTLWNIYELKTVEK